MKLHQDINAFRVLIDDIHNKAGYREDVLEKDYYVVLMLEELAQKQKEGLPAYFKGGTALYKALKSTNRFSEDIDLSVDTRGCNNTQNNKRLEKSTKRFDSLSRDRDLGKTNRSEVISVYTYEPITHFDADDALQRFGKLKIEATSFTISEPVTELEITPMIYDLATKEQQQILEELYEVKPFSVKTITTERIFIDKLFAAEAYVRKSDDPHRAFEAAKHIYDLTVLSTKPVISNLISDQYQIGYLLKIRLTEELERRDGIPGILPRNFLFFTEAENNSKVKSAYDIMQKQYVLRESDCIPYEAAMCALKKIKEELENNPSWMKCNIPKREKSHDDFER